MLTERVADLVLTGSGATMIPSHVAVGSHTTLLVVGALMCHKTTYLPVASTLPSLRTNSPDVYKGIEPYNSGIPGAKMGDGVCLQPLALALPRRQLSLAVHSGAALGSVRTCVNM